MKLLSRNQAKTLWNRMSYADHYEMSTTFNFTDDKFAFKLQNNDLRPLWLSKYFEELFILKVQDYEEPV